MIRIKNLNNKAFSLLEVLLASIIFIITVAGLFVTLNAMRKPVSDKESALTAALFGKQVLESLRSQVNAGTYYGACGHPNGDGSCGDFSLYLGAHEVTSANLGINWPSNLISVNNSCDANGCLTYNVSCGMEAPRVVILLIAITLIILPVRLI